MNRTKRFFIFIPAFLLVAACTQKTVTNNTNDNTNGGETTQEESIKIGFTTPLTGNLASLGVDMRNVAEMYLEEHPTWLDKKVELIVEDDKCDPTAGLNAINKLIETDKVQVVFADTCSGPFLTQAPVANRNKVLLLSSGATSPEITTEGGDYGFRNAPSDDTSSDVMLAYIASRYPKFGILAQNSDFSQAYKRKLEDKAESYDLEIVFNESFNEDTTDFKTVLAKVKEANPGVLVNLASSGIGAGLISKQMIEQGLDIPEIGTDYMKSVEYIESAKTAADGMVFVITAVDDSDERVQAFMKKYEERFGNRPNFDAYAALGWDKMEIIRQAIESVGEYNAEKIKDWLYEMPAYDGLGGETAFDENGDSSITPRLMTIEGGEYRILTEEE